jgi:hypothetical protein
MEEKMKNKTLFLFWLIVVSLTICSCKSDNHYIATDPSDYKRRMYKEMEGEVQKLLENISTKCEDSYYGFKDKHQLYEFKELYATAFEGEALKPKQLTEAEKLNQKQEGKVDDTVNPEWEGKVGISTGANRSYSYKDKHWSKWQDKEPLILHSDLYGNYKLKKLNGQWLSEPSLQYIQSRYSKPDCSEIPK